MGIIRAMTITQEMISKSGRESVSLQGSDMCGLTLLMGE